ncbi:zinc carboxypeptidase [Pedobacter lusitanus]|uniref:Zinc carboxypeptidase n=1 Tax=Pedobacter lusitanus TaxID=1503925 RepID=A0A0D0GK26_9SPHI|nr:M14 metallopeptidase family protein [Pedobacter lusitanus]KIO76515.1 zinc carboxypeptidase [Pedobacter lusitanus]
MKRIILSFLSLLLCFTAIQAQIKSPDAFLGYPLGTKFTSHHQVLAYFKYLAAADNNIRLINYGRSYENRELLVAVVSSKENMANLDQIRKNNLSLSKAEGGLVNINKQPAILWLSYNVHGNEASSTETAMKMLYSLAEGVNRQTKDWLKNTVVVIDPCLNPDGRERYINYYNAVAGVNPDANPMAREHTEPWPGGRSNHYYFDLNRDWAWQSQIETQQRLLLYHQWMPEVHIDFHEQSYNEPYYFAPAAEPMHQDITAFQREFQVIAGKNNAKYFDKNGWQYFTKERFDLLYPSYGDTYPLYNGAIGMTYEQGGIGAGLVVITANGDSLTLSDRIYHHLTTGLATLETVSDNSYKLVAEFKKYFTQAVAYPSGIYKTYVVKADNVSRMKKMTALLTKNNIKYAFGGDKTVTGFNFATKKTVLFRVGRNDMVINLKQPASVLANVLFEPQTVVTDSNTYDITAWALPYAYGLNAYGCKELLTGEFPDMEPRKDSTIVLTKPYGWVLSWDAVEDAQVLIALHRANIKVRIAEQAFTIGGKIHPAGSLLIYRSENERVNKMIETDIVMLSKKLKKPFIPISGSYVEKGKDFGSSVYPLLPVPKVAMVAGTDISSQSAGEVWHFFDRELNYPLNIISEQAIGSLNLATTNVLILPDGSYMRRNMEKLEDWINLGGKVILMEDAISSVAGIKPFDIKKKEQPVNTEKEVFSRSYREKDRDNSADAIPGAIYRVTLDKSHPFAIGLGDTYYTLKTDEKIYEPLQKGWNVGVLKQDAYVTGIAGKNVQDKLSQGMLFGVQPAGKGNVVYLSGDLLFRSFWESGKQLFVNTIFLVF